ncbi:MAG: polyisoprenoid-binding protein [Proteobacteria bacterium]|nr:polyisoprenoid-binding protein [Pseudomonadota bacterium]
MKTFLTAVALTTLAAVAQAEPATYAIDPTHTTVVYEIMHFNTSTNRGRFDKKEGSVTLDRAAKTGKVEVTFDTGSVNSGVPALNKHLMSKDFFDSETYPTAKFVGDKFTFDGDKVTEVAGQLTMRGKTNPVTLKAVHFNCYQSPMLKREVCGGDFETTITRSQWDVSYGLNYGFSDQIHLLIQVEAVKQ